MDAAAVHTLGGPNQERLVLLQAGGRQLLQLQQPRVAVAILRMQSVASRAAISRRRRAPCLAQVSSMYTQQQGAVDTSKSQLAIRVGRCPPAVVN